MNKTYLLKALNPFAKPNYASVLNSSIDQTKLDLLEAQQTLETAQARVGMYHATLERLKRTQLIEGTLFNTTDTKAAQ